MTAESGPPHSSAGLAKRALGIDRLVLQIHDASFPSDPEEDLGRGSPYTRGAERFFTWAVKRGFDAIQFGPRGMTSRGNASPYDATIFSRNPLDLPLRAFVDRGRLSQATWTDLRRALPGGGQGAAPYRLVFDAYQRALAEVTANASADDRAATNAFLAQHESWLVPDALYGALCREHGAAAWRNWSGTPQAEFDRTLFHPPRGAEAAAAARLAELRRQYAQEIEDYAFLQWLLHVEHQALRGRLQKLGLALYADLQVGLSQHDMWSQQRLFLANYLMGAPPSRTNPEGQPWGYPVFDPGQFGTTAAPGPALAFVRARVARVLAECDGVRIDHPHGWVDPWVYRADLGDALAAVQAGARLFSSPSDPRHPALGPYAIARTDQIDLAQPLYGDHHVRTLDDDQARRYSLLVDEIVTQQAQAGQPAGAVACEVLSTLPYPVARVLKRHGLGRFRVVQKTNPRDPSDVYRIENAAPQDWIMLGTHDTATIWQLAGAWCQGEAGQAWGEYLASLLAPPAERSTLAAAVARDAGQLVNACFTAMLASSARQVAVFFPDLFGLTERYNAPGLVNDLNWTLRVPADFERFYDAQLARGHALHVEQCLQRAAALVARPA